MATYLERYDIVSSGNFLKRLQVALWHRAATWLDDVQATQKQKLWSSAMLKSNADSETLKRVAIRAAASAAVSAAGEAVTDTDLQTVVNTVAVDLAA